MAYLGPKPSQTLATSTSQYFNGTGSQTVFTLNRAVNVSEDLEVFVNNIQQEPGVGKSYTASGTTLTFDAAPSSGTANVYVVYRGLAEVTTRLEHDANSALAATTGTFSGSVTATGLTSTNSGVTLQSASVTKSALNVAATTNQGINGTAAGDQYNWTTGGKMLWSTNSGTNAHLVLDSGGNVGIGETAPVTPLTITTANKLGSTFTGNINGEGLTVTQTNYTDGNYISLVEAAYDDSNDANPNVRIGAKFTGAGSSLAFGTSNNYSAGINNIAMTIDYEGKVGIGTSSPSRALEITDGTSGKIRASGTSGGFIECWNGTNGVYFGTAPSVLGTGNGGDSVIFTDSGFNQLYYTSGVERMRIDSSGNLRIGTNTAQITAERVSITGGLGIQKTDSYPLGLIRGNTYGQIVTFFNYSGSLVGSINVAASSTSYNTTSDYRLKENVTADWDATTRLKQLNPVRFNFIADADTTVDGFLAHEVQDIVPEAISGTKDGMRDEEYEVTPAVEATYDDDGNVLTEAVPAVMGTRSVPDYQGIDQAKLVPLLVKTIQELEARIAALEAN